MSKSEERVGSAPWMKMMHLMVNRRKVPDKKTSSVNETLNDGLATFALDNPQQILKHPPRRSFKYPEPDSLPSPRNHGDEAVHRKNSFKEVANSSKETNGDCDEGNSKKKLNKRHCRKASLDAKQQDNIRPGATLTTSFSFKENRLGTNSMPTDDSTGKFAYISLDGRLINAELATSASSIGGRLGDEEAQAWADFAPMQRVLIVALSAAAAAAAKHRNQKEIDLLLKTVENRENELVSLRQELSELCNQSHSNASQIHPEPLQFLENLAVRLSPKTPAQREIEAMRRSFDRDSIKLKLDLHEAWSSTKPATVTPYVVESELRGGDSDEPRLSQDSPVNKDVVFAEATPCKRKSFGKFPVSDESWAKEETKWYVNPMVETSQDFYDISTPERCNSMYSVCNPAVQGSFEWTVMRSSFASRETDLPVFESPPIKTTVSNSSYQTRSQMVDDGAVHKEHKAMRAVCAAVVLDLRKRMLSVLDKEASMVMDALDTNVEEAKNQVAPMHLAVASCWNASVPKALAALSLTPSEFDSYLLTNEAQETSTWNDISKIEESIVAWRQYLETNYGPKVPSEGGDGKSPNKWSSTERMVFVCGADERPTPLAYPQYSGQNEDLKFGSQSGLACSKNSTEDLTEQLLGELEKATMKVAVMENQMKKLEQDISGCEGKRTCKLTGCIERDLENQVKGSEDLADLVRQRQAKEVEVADLKKGQQNLKRKSKTRKIEENVLCPMATPKGYGIIYWERAAGQKKTKFHTEAGECKIRNDIVMAIDEPKALLDSRSKEIEELKEDFKKRDAELDKQLAAAESTKAANADRLAMLEGLCRQKDSALSSLKQDFHSLESKVQNSRVFQSPAVPRARRNSTSYTPSSSSAYGPAQKYAPSPSGSFCSDPILEHIGRFRREVPNNKGHYRNIPFINTQRHEELTDDGRSEHGYDLETSHEYSSPPGSTIGDDCSVNSFAFSENEIESRLGSECCSSGDDSRYRSAKDRLSGAKGSSYNRTLQKKNLVTSDLRRALTSTASSTRSRTQLQPSKISTFATSGSKSNSGEIHSMIPLSRTLSGEAKKVMKGPNIPQARNSKVLGAVVANTAINHRRSSSLDMNFKSNICAILELSGTSGCSLDSGPLDSQENAAIKRKRWV